MKPSFPHTMASSMALSMTLIATALGSPVAAAESSAWRAANERVGNIGGWRTYARDTLPKETSPCAISTISTASDEVSLSDSAAMTVAVAPRPWPPRAWLQAEGSSQRVAVDGDLVHVASRARALWVAAVSAEASLHLAARHYDAVDAAAELASRLHAVGNLPLADAVHEQKAHAEAAIACMDAVHARNQARRALARHLNLDAAAADALRLPLRLPPLPDALLDASRQSELLARSSQQQPGAPVALRLADLNADYRHRWAVAQRHEKDIRPLVEKLREESVLRYNGMLIGPDELLKIAREALESERASLAALTAFWQADTALQAALMGHPGSGE